jgi:hypothetical protein
VDITVRPSVVGLYHTTKMRSSPEKALKHALTLEKAQGRQLGILLNQSVDFARLRWAQAQEIAMSGRAAGC